jgi:hypothetical protein
MVSDSGFQSVRFVPSVSQIENSSKIDRKKLATLAKIRERSFEQDALRSIDEIRGDLDVIRARVAEAVHGLNLQGDLLRAAEALVGEVERLPTEAKGEAINEAVTKVQAVVRVIELSAAAMVRRMHTI